VPRCAFKYKEVLLRHINQGLMVVFGAPSGTSFEQRRLITPSSPERSGSVQGKTA
jgi:hypothetical protein